MSQIRVNIDGLEIVTYQGKTILEVAKDNQIHIPTLCQHDAIANYGSCGICVVEVEGNPRLIRSCSTEISSGMIIKTQTERIVASRKTTVELMLSDHVGDCKAPCSLGCPGQVDIQGYVGLIANGAYAEALELIKKELPLPASVGRVCPHPCQAACRRGLLESPVHIAWLKRYVADLDLEKELPYMPAIAPDTGKKVAIIGGGPSGLSAAYYLRQKGHQVTIYEAMPEFGGMLKYGIPLYRLPKEVLLGEVKTVERMGVILKPNIKIGRDVTLDYLKVNFHAIYVAVGAWRSTIIECPGTELNGVHGGIDFLNKFAINAPIKLGKRIAVIGGGNTAMDAARTSIRLGAEEVYAIYRRTKADMPAVDVEIDEAEEEGVQFKFLLNPIAIVGDDKGNVIGIRLQKMVQTAPDASGRRSVIPVPDEEEFLAVDAVIMSIGQQLNPIGLDALGFNRQGFIAADPHTFQTNIPGIFAGGDCTNKGASIAIEAIAEGKYAARVMHTYLEGHMVPHVHPYTVKREDVTALDFLNVLTHQPSHMGHERPDNRKHNFEEVVYGYSEEEAHLEASRCLECGCHDVFECDLYKYANAYDVKPDRLAGEKHSRPLDSAHPYILRDTNKCILCGMCVRICDEVMDNAAIGLINRGYNTVVMPELGKDLIDTECISCGQCVSVCPTGALQERKPIAKQVPLEAETVHTICHGCSLGCNINMEHNGNLLLRALPSPLLCVKGKFEFGAGKRIHKPLLRKNGQLVEVSYEEALLYIARKAQSLHLIHGQDAVAIALSGHWTNEAIASVKQFGNRILETNRVFSLHGQMSGIKAVLGNDASTNSFSELANTSCILAIGTDAFKHHTIAALDIKKAVASGAKLLTVNTAHTKLSEWSQVSHLTHDIDETLKAMAAYVVNNTQASAKIEGYSELKEQLKSTTVPEAIASLMREYLSAPKAMIVFDETLINTNAQILIAAIAVLSGHIGSARSGIIQLRPHVNSQGLVDMGVDTHAVGHFEAIETGRIKGLLVFGDTADHPAVSGLDFLMVMATQHNALTDKADVILPAETLYESQGTVTSADRRIQRVNKVVDSTLPFDNIEVLVALMNIYSTNCTAKDSNDLLEWIHKNIPNYNGVKALVTSAHWPIGGSKVLYEHAFATDTGRAKLSVYPVE